MGRPSTNTKYVSIIIPFDLKIDIDKIIYESKGDYTSRPDVIKTAVRILCLKNKRNKA